MHKLMTSLAIAGALVASSVGMASAAMMAAPKMAAPATKTITGVVLSVNTKLCTVTLSNEGVYLFAKGCKLSKITVGEWVTVTWWLSGNSRDASNIVAAKPMSGMMMMGMMH